MKILFVIHQFLPRHLAGSEVYTYALAKEMQRRGHAVAVFCTEIDPARPQYDVARREYDGIPCVEVVHNRSFPTFEHMYRDEDMEALFSQVLDERVPDIVHVQHLQLHSIGYLAIAKNRGLPIVYTLHEYMLMCLREGQLLLPDARLCTGPQPSSCATCATVPPHQRKPLQSTPAIRRVSAAVGRQPVLAGLARRLWRLARGWAGPNDDAYVGAVANRLTAIREALRDVDVFLAPSRFLRERFIASGLVAADRIAYSRYGMQTAGYDMPRTASPRVRFGFVGTIASFKGVHLLLEAFRDIPADDAVCRIYGDIDTFPEYRDRLLAAGVPPAVELMGRLEPGALPAALADIDVLVVPSIWYENAPLTIQEAQLAGVPVITSDCGGMAELVEDGIDGLLFCTGDARDLRRQVMRCLCEPELLPKLRAARPFVRSIADDAEEMEARYGALLSETA